VFGAEEMALFVKHFELKGTVSGKAIVLSTQLKEFLLCDVVTCTVFHYLLGC